MSIDIKVLLLYEKHNPAKNLNILLTNINPFIPKRETDVAPKCCLLIKNVCRMLLYLLIRVIRNLF